MAEKFGFSQETMDIAVDAAFAANVAYDQVQAVREQQSLLDRVVNLNLEHIEVSPGAEAELSLRARQAEANFEALLSMAGVVTTSVNPYQVSGIENLPRQHDFVTWRESESEGNIPTISQDNFRAIYSCINGVDLRHKKVASKTFTTIETLARRETKIPHPHGLAPTRAPLIDQSLFWHEPRERRIDLIWLRADKLDELAKYLRENIDNLYGLGSGTVAVIDQVAAFVRFHKDSLIAPSSQAEGNP